MTIYKYKLFMSSASHRATTIDLGRRGWRRVLALVAMLAMSLGGHPAVAGGWPHLSLLGLTAATTAHAEGCDDVKKIDQKVVCKDEGSFQQAAKACLTGDDKDSTLLTTAINDATALTGIGIGAPKDQVQKAIADVNTASTALDCQLVKCTAMRAKFESETCAPPPPPPPTATENKKRNLTELRDKISALMKSLGDLDVAGLELSALKVRLDATSGAGGAAGAGSGSANEGESTKDKESEKGEEPGINWGTIAAGAAGVGAALSKEKKPKQPPKPCGTLATMKEDRCQEHLAEKCKSVKDDFPDSEKAKTETRTICRAWAEDHHCKLGGSAPICNELRLIKICETEPSCPKCKIESMLNECKKSQGSAQGCGGKPLDDAAILSLCSAKKFCLSEDPNCAKLKENIKKGELPPPMTPGGP